MKLRRQGHTHGRGETGLATGQCRAGWGGPVTSRPRHTGVRGPSTPSCSLVNHGDSRPGNSRLNLRRSVLALRTHPEPTHGTHAEEPSASTGRSRVAGGRTGVCGRHRHTHRAAGTAVQCRHWTVAVGWRPWLTWVHGWRQSTPCPYRGAGVPPEWTLSGSVVAAEAKDRLEPDWARLRFSAAKTNALVRRALGSTPQSVQQKAKGPALRVPPEL